MGLRLQPAQQTCFYHCNVNTVLTIKASVIYGDTLLTNYIDFDGVMETHN